MEDEVPSGDGRLASETATALLQSQPCEQFDTSRPDGAVRCKTSHQRRKHAMHPILLLGGVRRKLTFFANHPRNAPSPGIRNTRVPAIRRSRADLRMKISSRYQEHLRTSPGRQGLNARSIKMESRLVWIRQLRRGSGIHHSRSAAFCP